MKNKSNTQLVLIAISILVLAILVLGYFKNLNVEKPFIEVNKFYDNEGNPIKVNSLAVVNGVEGVRYISLAINVLNKDSVSLTFLVNGLSPSSIISALPTNKLTIASNKTGTFLTGLIDVSSYVGTSQNFCASVVSEAILSLRQPNNKSGCITVRIDQDPSGSFDLQVSSSTENSSITPPPTPEENDTQTNTSTFNTNTDGSYSSYTLSSNYISLDTDGNNVLETYYYKSTQTVTSGGCPGTFILTTPSGITLNKYSGSSGLNIYMCSPTKPTEYKRFA